MHTLETSESMTRESLSKSVDELTADFEKRQHARTLLKEKARAQLPLWKRALECIFGYDATD